MGHEFHGSTTQALVKVSPFALCRTSVDEQVLQTAYEHRNKELHPFFLVTKAQVHVNFVCTIGNKHMHTYIRQHMHTYIRQHMHTYIRQHMHTYIRQHNGF
jgi:hypothetical protein